MAATMTTERPPATPEEIWAILRETAERQRENERRWEQAIAKREAEDAERRAEETKRRAEEAERKAKNEAEDAKLREREAKWLAEEEKRSAELNARFERTEKLVFGTNEKVGGLERTFGEVVEHLVAPGIEDRFSRYGMVFDNVFPGIKIKENRQLLAEIDLLLEGEDALLAVEIKAKVKTGDVRNHVARLEKLRGYYDRRNDRRRLFGAMAGAVFNSQEKKAALEAGFFVIMQSGDTMQVEVPESFKPRQW